MTPIHTELPDGTTIALLIAAIAALTAASRLVGFFLLSRPGETAFGRALHYLPYGLFAGIIVASAPIGGRELDWIPGLGAIVVTAFAARRGRSLLLALATGLLCAALLQWLLFQSTH